MVSHKGETKEYSKKKRMVSIAQFYAEIWCSKGQSYKKLVSRKKYLKFFFHVGKQLIITLDHVSQRMIQPPTQIT